MNLNAQFRAQRILLVILLAVFVTGCGTSASQFDNVFAGTSEKSVLLSQRVDKFNKAVLWGNIHEVIEYVAPEHSQTFVSDFRKRKKSEQFVDYSIEEIAFKEDKSSAEVNVKVRYFRVPNYVVETRHEIQVWEFDRFDSGWRLHDVKPAPKDDLA